MTITWDDVVDLLAFAAVFDYRDAGEIDIKAWLAVATVHHWDPAAVQRVITDHYGADAERPRITPAMITDRLRSMRSAAAESFVPPEIPADLGGRTYPEWYRAQQKIHVDRCLSMWAATGEEIRAIGADPARFATMRDLANGAPRHVQAELNAGLRRIEARRIEP